LSGNEWIKFYFFGYLHWEMRIWDNIIVIYYIQTLTACTRISSNTLFIPTLYTYVMCIIPVYTNTYICTDAHEFAYLSDKYNIYTAANWTLNSPIIYNIYMYIVHITTLTHVLHTRMRWRWPRPRKSIIFPLRTY